MQRWGALIFIIACIMIVAGIWTEKGLGFVVPTANELLICAGIWAFGLLFNLMTMK